jgi:hypothetical protein
MNSDFESYHSGNKDNNVRQRLEKKSTSTNSISRNTTYACKMVNFSLQCFHLLLCFILHSRFLDYNFTFYNANILLLS